MLIKAEDSLVVIIDVQERLAPAMSLAREVISGCTKLLEVAGSLGVPYLITEQYPTGLGRTMADLRHVAAADTKYYPKLEFSCFRNESIREAIAQTGKKQIILAGVELHVCILQSAFDLKSAGYDVFVAADACSSIDSNQHKTSLRRMTAGGIEIVSLEMIIYEWLEKAGTEKFKDISVKYLR